jgi:Rho-binding antiterminator
VSDYIPIDCALYGRYEIAILHKQRLRVAWRDADGSRHLERLLPIDLQTRDHAEYLIATTVNGTVTEIRLDRIVRTDPV